VSAFGRLMRETLALQPQQIVVDQTPVQVYMETILERLALTPRLAFSSLFAPPHERGRIVGILLALLELVKGQQIAAEQAQMLGEIWLSLPTRSVPLAEAGPARQGPARQAEPT